MLTVEKQGRRKVAAVLLTFLLVVQVGIFGFSGNAKAFVMDVWDVATAQQYGLEKGADIVRVGLVGSATLGLISAVNYIAQKIAYDTATAISEGAPGQAPLFNPSGYGDYLKQTADEAAGFMIDALSQSGLAPFNLCDPNNARLNLSLALSWVDAKAPQKPTCSFTEMVKNYDTFAQRVQTGEALKQFSVAFEPNQSGTGVAVDSSSRALVTEMKKVNAALQDRLEGMGFKNLGDAITGKTLTPSALIRQKALEGADQGTKAQTMSYDAMGKAIAAAPEAIGLAAVNTFINHLVGALLTKALGKGFYYTLADATCALGVTGCGGIFDVNSGGSADGAGAIRNQNADLITPPLQVDNKYSPIDEFSSCPDQFRTVNNCVMDSQFSAALTRATPNGNKYLTVQEAIDQGYMHGDWPLISNSEAHRARNADPFCYTSGYCYSNLLKLRKHRILPIGWELAAAKSPDNPIKLKEVIAGFNDCPTADDPNPLNHPWCHLIDPNWILKLPATQCRMRVNGPTLLSQDAPGRAQTCVDTPSCIGDDKFGNCTQGYGYCIRDENIWRLGGTECQAPYASCASFNGRNGDQLLALQNTIDHGVCTANNVGCRPYSLVRSTPSSTVSWSYIPGQDRVFVNKDAADCDASGAGCIKVIDKEGLRRNLVLNSSFEDATTDQGTYGPKYWDRLANSKSWTTDSQFARTGTRSILLNNSGVVDPEETVPIEADTTYTVSYYGRQEKDAGKGAAILRLFLLSSISSPNGAIGVSNIPVDTTTCQTETKQYNQSGSGKTVFVGLQPVGTNWTRTQCTFVTPPNVTKAGKELYPKLLAIQLNKQPSQLDKNGKVIVDPNDPVYIDDVQIEEGVVATDYHTTAYEFGAMSVQKTYKVPPESLGCVGDKTVDPSACANYAPVCRADEVGCERYTPNNGGTPITAITSLQNSCPTECVGYETFRKEASVYDLEAYPKYFIPTTATQCSVAAAGCTEFTNMDVQQAGGEGREYYSYLRQCEKPINQVPTYYTWEGSDTTGYQLKEWHLKSGLPFDNSEKGSPPNVVTPYDPLLCTKDIFDKGLTADCRQFFDVAGNVSYRLYSKTIVITADCHPYRITQPPVIANITDQAFCEGYKYHWIAGSNICVACETIGGVWNATTNACFFNGYKNESDSCTAAQNGCRLFTGSAGGNVQNVLDEGFESNLLTGWKFVSSTVTTSTESTIVGGHSLRMQGPAMITRSFSSSSLPQIEQNGLYTLEFWAKGPGGEISNAFMHPNGAGQTLNFISDANPAALSSNWHLYSFGPVRAWAGNFGTNVDLSIFATIPANNYWFIDNIVLKKVGSAIAVIDGTWKTPLTCDETTDGTYLPQAQLGCELYTTHKNASVPLKSFDTLCRDAAVGCRAFINTQNHDFIGYEYWNAMALTKAPVPSPTDITDLGEKLCTVATNNSSCRYHETSTVPATIARDTRVTCTRDGRGSCYIDGVYICTADKLGKCTAIPSDLVTVQPHKTVYVVDDDAYACDASQLGCTEVGVASGSVCRLTDKCSPGNTGTVCLCKIQQEVCLPNEACKLSDVFECNVAVGQTTCTFAVPKNEPFLGQYVDPKDPVNSSLYFPNSTYNTKTILLDPSKYDQQICTGNAVGCDSWQSKNMNAPSLSYFKNPDGRSCEYREGVVIDGVTYSGYFLVGTDAPCDATYLISGNYYGIRKNADLNYQGFVGSCPSDQASCNEYQDPNDTKFVALSTEPAFLGRDYGALKSADPLVEPKRYYYLKDKSIDYASCNGQVSKKDGCVLINDTSDLNLSYNAAGTYDNSDNKNFAQVPAMPGVCEYVSWCPQSDLKPDGGQTKVELPTDLKAGYLSGALVNWKNYTDADGIVHELFDPHFGAATYFRNIDLGKAEALCAETDPNNTNFGHFKYQMVRYQANGCVSDVDCSGGGHCNLQAPDTNAVIKVQRDRICSQWYACKSSTPVWDPHVNRFRESCDELGICDQASGAGSTSASVDISQCKHWVIGAAATTILSEPVYQSRDISWTGQEYSGYAVPHQFPASALSSLLVKSQCQAPDKNLIFLPCTSSSDCPGGSECKTQTSLGRDVGICPDQADGTTCDSDCGNILNKKVWLKCETDKNYCQTFPATCNFNKNNPDHTNTTLRDGGCYQGRCYQSPYGNPNGNIVDEPMALNTTTNNGYIPVSCRAYPETDSPVPTDVVTTWNNTDAFDSTRPLSIKQGFQSANVCLPGQDCECKYYKESFGTNSGTKYLEFSARGQGFDGTCSGGDDDGLICYVQDGIKRGIINKTPYLGCRNGGTCKPILRKDVVSGLEGYCLERDQVTPIYGRQDGTQAQPARACLTWLPVDRISGQPDIFNQYTSASFSILDTYECLIPQLYKVVQTYGEGNDDGDVGLAGNDGNGAKFVTWNETGQKLWVGCAASSDPPGFTGCGKNATDGFGDQDVNLSKRGVGNMFVDCPPDTGFIVVDNNEAGCGPADSSTGCPGTDYEGGDLNELCTQGDNGFKYICVPWGSVHTTGVNHTQGSECLPTDLIGPGLSQYPNPCDAVGWTSLKNTDWDSTIGEDGNKIKDAACNHDNVIPKFHADLWPADSTPRKLGMKNGYATYTVLSLVAGGGPPFCSPEVLGRMSDCAKIDAPVGSARYAGAVGHAVGLDLQSNFQSLLDTVGAKGKPTYPYYLGCQVLAQVAKMGDPSTDTNKAWTERTGGSVSQAAPPGSTTNALKTGHLETNYIWDTPVSPFGTALGKQPGLGVKFPFETVDLGAAGAYTNSKPPVWANTDKPMPYVYVSTQNQHSYCDNGGSCFGFDTDGMGAGAYNIGMGHIQQIFQRAYGFLGWVTNETFSGEIKSEGDKLTNAGRGYKQLFNFLANEFGDSYKLSKDTNMDNLKGYSKFTELWRDLSTESSGKYSYTNTPQLIGVGKCDIDNHCYEDQQTQMTVNGKTEGNVVGGGGWERVIFKFFATAGNSADPIRDVRVIWNTESTKLSNTTGNSGKFVGMFKNHRGYSKFDQKTLCNNLNFGTSPDACDDSSPFTFVHNYTCNNGIGINKGQPHCEDGTDTCWQEYLPPGENKPKMVCMYHPAVYILNNWGMCTGRCGDGNSPAGTLCSNDGGTAGTIDNSAPEITINKTGSQKAKDECVVAASAAAAGNIPWVSFPGTVIVFPED